MKNSLLIYRTQISKIQEKIDQVETRLTEKEKSEVENLLSVESLAELEKDKKFSVEDLLNSPPKEESRVQMHIVGDVLKDAANEDDVSKEYV